jgi:hypothetical protein
MFSREAGSYEVCATMAKWSDHDASYQLSQLAAGCLPEAGDVHRRTFRIVDAARPDDDGAQTSLQTTGGPAARDLYRLDNNSRDHCRGYGNRTPTPVRPPPRARSKIIFR